MNNQQLKEEAKKDFLFYTRNFKTFPANDGERQINDFEEYFKVVWYPSHIALIKGCLLWITNSLISGLSK